MQFIDLAEQQKRIRGKIEENIRKVLDHGVYINGPEVRELEEKLAAYAGAKHAVGCSSGTDALLMPLMAYGIGPGDAVFTPTFTFIATAEVIALLGATPVFVDINPDTFNMDAAKLEEAIAGVKKKPGLKPRGVIPVDLFGQPADYDEINGTARRHGLFVIEDAAQSFGASYKGKKACSLSDVAATSFFPAKPFGCYGDGGMIFTDDDGMYERLLSIRVHGQGTDKYNNVRIGINGRLDTMQAAVMLAKLPLFEGEMRMRQTVAERYGRELGGTVKVPVVREHNVSAWAQYTLMHPDRDGMIRKLKNGNIPSAVYYPKPLHLQDAFRHLGHGEGDFPVSEEASRQVFSVPMHPYLSEKEQEQVVKAVKG